MFLIAENERPKELPKKGRFLEMEGRRLPLPWRMLNSRDFRMRIGFTRVKIVQL